MTLAASDRVRPALRALDVALDVVSTYLCPLSAEALILSHRPLHELSLKTLKLTT